MADISSTPPERTQLWWGPILRMILPLTFLRGLEVFLFVLLIAGETTWWVILLFVSALLCHIHNRSHWLFTLPVSRSKLFAFLLLPLLLLTSVLYIIHTFVFSLIRHTQDADPRIVMITIAVFAALQLLVIIGVHCAWWRGVGRTLRTTVAALCFLISAALLVPWYSWMSKLSIGSYRFHFERSTFQFALGWLSDTLPGNPWASAGIVVVFLSMLYWCASRQFCQLEVSRIRMTA